MIGAIIGDIVGSIYEFDNIKTKTFPFFSKEKEFTDDSILTLRQQNGCFVEAILQTIILNMHKLIPTQWAVMDLCSLAGFILHPVEL